MAIDTKLIDQLLTEHGHRPEDVERRRKGSEDHEARLGLGSKILKISSASL